MSAGLLPPVVAELMMDLHEFKAGADEGEARMGELTSSGSAMFDKIGKAAVVGTAAIGVASIKMASDFETQMTRLYTAAGAPKAAVQGAYGEVLKMGDAVGESGTAMAEALYHPVSAGLDLQTSLQAVKFSAQEAQISGASLDDTTYALSSVMKAFNQNASQAHDTMALLNAIVGQGDMKFQDFNQSVSNWAPTAAQMGISVQSMGAALAYLTDRGNSAQEAATRVTMGLTMMAYPSQKAATMLDGLGVATSDVSASSQAFTSVMQKTGITQNQLAQDLQRPDGIYVALNHLKTALSNAGVSATEADSIMSHIFGGGRSDKAILSLMQNLDGLKTKFNDIGTASGQFDQAWSDTQQTFSFKMKKLGAEIENVGIAIGIKLIPAVEKAVGWFAQHKAATEALALVIGAVLAVSVLRFAQTLTTTFLEAIGKAIVGIKSLGTASATSAAEADGAAVASVKWSSALGNTIPIIGGVALGAQALAGWLNHVGQKSSDAAADMNQLTGQLLSIANSGSAANTQMAALAVEGTELGKRFGGEMFKPIDDSLAQLVQGGNLKAAQKDIAAIDVQLKAAGLSTDAFHNSLTKFSDAAGAYVNQQKANALAATNATAATDTNTTAMGPAADAMKNVTGAADGTTGSINALDDAFSQLTGNINSSGTLHEFQKDLLSVKDQLDQNGKSFNDSTLDGLKNEEAFRQAAQAIVNYRDETIKNGTVVPDQANKIASAQAQSLLNTYEHLGVNKKAVEGYAAQLGLVPKNLYTDVTLNTSQALAAFNAYQTQLADITGGTLHQYTHKAAGGLVTGAGTETSDSIDAKLSANEYVVKASAVRQYGVPFLDALNSGAMPSAAPSISGGSGSGSGFFGSDSGSGGEVTVNVYVGGQQITSGVRTEVLRYNQRNSSSGWALAGTGFR